MFGVGLVLAGAVALPPVTSLPMRQQLMYGAKPVYCAGARGRSVALTFDDGPGPYTPRLVRGLPREHARATFFLVGSRVGEWRRAPRAPPTVGAVGNHTWSHPHLATLPPLDVWRELARAQFVIRRNVGIRPLVFRPPYEEATPRDDRIARSLSLVDVRWSVDTGDSRPGATARNVLRTARTGLRPGAIVLLHDLHPWTGAVARRLIRTARRRHLRLATVPELIARQPPSHRQLSSTGGTRCPR